MSMQLRIKRTNAMMKANAERRTAAKNMKIAFPTTAMSQTIAPVRAAMTKQKAIIAKALAIEALLFAPFCAGISPFSIF